jgi:methionyl aminopeptidase
VQEYVEKNGFGVVRRFVGHGIGARLHEKPEVPNFVPKGLPGLPLKAGMTIAIEPMVTEGSTEVDILEDRWTAVTKDRKLSAHFEHTIVLTSKGPKILSKSD